MNEKKGKNNKVNNNNNNNGNGSNKLMIAMIILLCVIIVGAGAFGAYYFIFSKNSKQVKNVNAVQSTASQSQASSKTYCLDEMTLNLADKDTRRYIKLTIYLGYEDKKLSKELDSKKPILRDAVANILRSKKASDFTSKGTEDIKQEILKRINPMFEKGRADNIYFYDILVQ